MYPAKRSCRRGRPYMHATHAADRSVSPGKSPSQYAYCRIIADNGSPATTAPSSLSQQRYHHALRRQPAAAPRPSQSPGAERRCGDGEEQSATSGRGAAPEHPRVPCRAPSRQFRLRQQPRESPQAHRSIRATPPRSPRRTSARLRQFPSDLRNAEGAPERGRARGRDGVRDCGRRRSVGSYTGRAGTERPLTRLFASEDMLNVHGALSGACATLLIDM